MSKKSKIGLILVVVGILMFFSLSWILDWYALTLAYANPVATDFNCSFWNPCPMFAQYPSWWYEGLPVLAMIIGGILLASIGAFMVENRNTESSQFLESSSSRVEVN